MLIILKLLSHNEAFTNNLNLVIYILADILVTNELYLAQTMPFSDQIKGFAPVKL